MYIDDGGLIVKKVIFKGAGVAIVTPFNDTGINFSEFGKIIEDQIAGGTNAIIVTGTTGESATMSDEEHRAAIKFVVDTVKKRIPVIAGTGSNETAYAVELTKYAKEIGADAALVVTPYYNKCTQKGLTRHYNMIADVGLPIILYSVPSRTGTSFKTETYKELSKHPNIVAVKEANGDLSSILRTRYSCGDDLHIYSGNDDQIVPILSLGGKGIISVMSNVAPKTVSDICKLYFDGKTEDAAKLQIEYSDLIDALFCEVNPIPVKTSMRLMGYNVGHLRMPLTDPEEKSLDQIKAALLNHGLIK